MCFIPPPGKKKCPSKTSPKVPLEGARIILGPEGARFSFSVTSKLPSNLSIRQDFYGKDKAQTSLPNGTTSTQTHGQYITPPTGTAQAQTWPQYGSPPAPAPAPQPANLVSQVAEAQRLAFNLKDACVSHSSCSSRASHSSHSSSSRTSDCNKDRIRDRDRDALLLTLERKNAEDIAALKLDRDIERKVTSAVRDRDVQALIGVAAGGGGGGGRGGCYSGGKGRGENGLWGCAGGPSGGEGGCRGMHGVAELERQREERLLREREREWERDQIRDRARDRKLIGSSSDSLLQLNLFQDLSSGGGGGGRGSYLDGIGDGWERSRCGWERRRSSVVSTLDRGARRLRETVARVEAEVESMRRHRDRDKDRGSGRDREWERMGSERGWRRGQFERKGGC